MQNNAKTQISFYERKITLDSLIHFFCFISVLFIGADIIGVNVGINLRLDQAFLVIMCLLLVVKDSYRLTQNRWLLAFVLFAFISACFAFNVQRGILFYCSIIYNVLFVFYTFSSYVKTYGIQRFISIFRKTCYVQFVIFIIQYALKIFFDYQLPFLRDYGEVKGIYRFCLWFYEPSYMATYFIFWFVVSIYMLICNKRGGGGYLIDTALSALMLILSTSTTGIIGLIVSVGIAYLIWLNRGITYKKLSCSVLLAVAGTALYFSFRGIFDVFLGRVFNSSLDSASGGRISAWEEAYAVFRDNKFFGVGPGNYGQYLGRVNTFVPTNVTLDLMATLGIFATVAFLCLTARQLQKTFKAVRGSKTVESRLFVGCALGLIVFFLLLQVNQGYLRLYHWMFLGILQSVSCAQSNRLKPIGLP